MGSSTTLPAAAPLAGQDAPAEPLPAERFFRASLFCLVLTSITCLVTTGKLDLFWSIAAPAAVLYKGHRLWMNRAPEISPRGANWLVIGYLFFFPIDIFVFSRMLTAGSVNPPL